MKNKKIFKTLSALCAALVLMMGLSVTAFAQGTEQPPAEDAILEQLLKLFVQKRCGGGCALFENYWFSKYI